MDAKALYETMAYMDYNLDEHYERMQMIELGTKGYLENNHPTVELLYNNELINIDVDMIELIQQIWDRGIKTSACCQGDEIPHDADVKEFLGNYAYISFPEHEYILKFIEEYQIIKHVGVFDVLNSIEEMKVQITADDIINHKPRSGDLYSTRFNNAYIQILVDYE